MAKRRQSEVELCFDSMTDLITNLAGGLVLVVLLLLGMTREARPEIDKAPPPPSQVVPDVGEKSIEPLLRQLNQLTAEIQGVDAEINRLNDRMPRIRAEVAELVKKSSAASNGKSENRDKQ